MYRNLFEIISFVAYIVKRANLNQFFKLNNILLFLTFMCIKMYYFAKYVIKNKITFLIT